MMTESGRRKKSARAGDVFGVALGTAETIAPQHIATIIGLDGGGRLVRWFGGRKIGSGIPWLLASDPAPWLWARVAGEALDVLTLARGMSRSNSRRRRARAAAAAVAPIAALDVWLAFRSLSHPAH